jgi:hypothetical protein
MGIKRPGPVGGGEQNTGPPEVGALAVAYPSVWAWLTDTRYDDGSSRQTSTLLIFTEDGSVKACLSDRDRSATGWASGATLEACLEALDKRLEAGTLDWRAKKPQGQQQGRRKS